MQSLLASCFRGILRAAIPASILILAILLIRVCFRKLPKRVSCAMWALAAVRLICPFSMKSALSVMPSAQVIPAAASLSAEIRVASNPVYPQAVSFSVPASGETFSAFSVIWLVGVLVMLLYAVLSSLQLRHTVRTATLYQPGVRQSEYIDSPFLLGIIRPTIYIPYAIAKEDVPYILAHEQAHIRRGDHLWKSLGFLLLSVYWFDPVIWVAYALLCRDIELACDEIVIRKEPDSYRRAYSSALLHCSVNHRSFSVSPLAFGEVRVAQRIKSVMRYRKPTFWVSVLAIVLCAALAVCFLTDPGAGKISDTEEKMAETPPATPSAADVQKTPEQSQTPDSPVQPKAEDSSETPAVLTENTQTTDAEVPAEAVLPPEPPSVEQTPEVPAVPDDLEKAAEPTAKPAETTPAETVPAEKEGSILYIGASPHVDSTSLYVQLPDGTTCGYIIAQGARIVTGLGTDSLLDLQPGDRLELEMTDGLVSAIIVK